VVKAWRGWGEYLGGQAGWVPWGRQKTLDGFSNGFRRLHCCSCGERRTTGRPFPPMPSVQRWRCSGRSTRVAPAARLSCSQPGPLNRAAAFLPSNITPPRCYIWALEMAPGGVIFGGAPLAPMYFPCFPMKNGGLLYLVARNGPRRVLYFGVYLFMMFTDNTYANDFGWLGLELLASRRRIFLLVPGPDQ
jgi:hypothetical protein